MRVGLAILMVTAGSAAAATVWLSSSSPDQGLAVITGIENGSRARIEPVDDRAHPGTPAQRFFGYALPPSSTDQAAPRPATTVLSPAPTASTALDGMSAVVVPAPAPAVRPRPRHEIASDIQRELRRVGCYAGEIDGDWGPATRRAMNTFTQRVNSMLPGDEPDMIQLTLVRGYPGTACATGATAPIVAVRPPSRPLEQRSPIVQATPVQTTTTTTPIANGRPYEPRIVSTPLPATRPQVQTVMPAAAPIAVVPPPAAVVAAPAAIVPLQGRMSVGGPVPTPEAIQAPPVSSVPAPKVARPRATQPSAQQAQRPPQRRPDRSWTGSFFQN